MESEYELSLVIPFYNEQENVQTVLYYLSSHLDSSSINYQIVAVENGSTDNTADLLVELSTVNPRIKVVTVKQNKGYGFGIISGFKAAVGDYVGFMCGDGQISPKDVVKTFSYAKNENLDFCKVRRIVRYDGLIRYLLSSVYNLILSVFFKVTTSDINGTPKILRRTIYEKLDLTSNDWFIDTEMMLKIGKMGYKVSEVDVEFKKRAAGESNVKFIIIFEFLRNLIRFRFGV